MKPSDLIVVIDMQNAYLPGQPWGCDSFARSCENIQASIQAAEQSAAPPAICFTRFLSDPNATGVWAEYNVKNRDINDDPWMNEIVDDLKPRLQRYPLYTKSVYSSMRIPELRAAAERAGRVVLTGVMSECCVLSTCMEAIDMGCHVVYLRDACSGDDATMEDSVLTILKGLSPLHVTILDTTEYLQEYGP